VAEQELLAANATATQEQRTDVETTPTGEEQPAVDAEVTEAEDEKQLTLDEWKAMQERERAKPAFNIRKPGEGCQTAPEWKKMVVLKKKVNDEDQDEEEEEEEEDDDEDHSRQKQTVPIQIRFNDTATRGGAGFRGRGGRGRGGRRPAGDGGAERPRNSAAGKTEAVPNVDNEFDFPSLA
jgi:plasminogen activator inhibitor 1 RNA-binding protein